MGTADYIAPEAIKGEEVSNMFDIWSLGVIGYQLLLGKLPFNDSSWELVRERILNQEIEWPKPGYE